MAVGISSEDEQFPPLRSPSPMEMAAFRSRVTAHNPGVGVVDLLSGQIYFIWKPHRIFSEATTQALSGKHCAFSTSSRLDMFVAL